MFKLTINQFEKKRLLFYADQTLSESLHWGGGAVIIPEEQILLDAIKESKGKLTLDSFKLELLLNWLFDATGEGQFLLGEDISIINKIIGGLAEYRCSLKNGKTKDNIELEEIEFQLNFVEKMLKKLIYMLPETEKKEEIEELKEEIEFEEKVKRAKVLKNEREKAEKIMKENNAVPFRFKHFKKGRMAKLKIKISQMHPNDIKRLFKKSLKDGLLWGINKEYERTIAIYMLVDDSLKKELDDISIELQNKKIDIEDTIKEEIKNRVEPMPTIEKKEVDYRTEDTSLLDEKIKKVAEERRGIKGRERRNRI